jgi:hypothetical protein
VAGAFGGRTTEEGHDTATSILEGSLEQADGDAQGDTSAAEGALVIGHGPWVALHLLEDIGDLELGLLDGQEEAGSGAKGRTLRLLLRGHARTRGASNEAQHLLDLLGGVVLVASEHIRLGALGIAKLVHLGLNILKSISKHFGI